MNKEELRCKSEGERWLWVESWVDDKRKRE